MGGCSQLPTAQRAMELGRHPEALRDGVWWSGPCSWPAAGDMCVP